MWRLLAVCAAVVSMAAAHCELWENYKECYGVSFEEEEESWRKAVFEKNKKRIETHNAEADLGKHTYWLGINHFTHMTEDEFAADVTGSCLRLDRKARSAADGVHDSSSNLAELPAEVDWRNKGYVTPVKDQGQCGSCWAFSTTGSLEGQWFGKTGRLVPLSEQNLVDCSGAYGNLGCQGGLMDDAFSYIRDNGGVDTEASYPYTGRNGQCRFNKTNVGATDMGFVDIPAGNETALMHAVATVGPVSVAIDAGHSSIQFYHQGVYDEPSCSSTHLDHGVLAVGYGTYNSKAYWLVKNSWNTTWGDGGYIMMARNKNNQCGIATQASYPRV
ncbi:CTSL [Branchiostoma lanceolatum]|uniref:CTSL protein n=1 Tax=Branchiostoma lanceolatum TaxID=7740 RepID=A0A8J9V749_BRALA|nr:CTSL [Branchiostoma lanceolatum]